MHLLFSMGSFTLFLLKHFSNTKTLHPSIWKIYQLEMLSSNCFNRIFELQALYRIWKRGSRPEVFSRKAVLKNFNQNRIHSYLEFFFFQLLDMRVYYESNPSSLFSEWFCETFQNILQWLHYLVCLWQKTISLLRKQTNTQVL